MLSARYYVAMVLGALACGLVLGQESGKPGSRLSARELFYATLVPARQQVTRPAAAERPRPPVSKPTGDKPAPSKTEPPSVRTPEKPAATGTSTSQVAAPASTPLGLRYSLLKRTQPRRYDEVSVDSVFRSGDRIRVAVESNDAAYLYIVQRGTSGAWDVLFPNAAIQNGDNRVKAGQRYEIPGDGVYSFDDRVGEELVFVILTREPETDLEKLIYDMARSVAPAKPASRPSPAEPQEAEAPATLMARLDTKTLVERLPPVDNDVIDRIKNRLNARDLVFEKIDENEARQNAEKAMYVVNAAGGKDARVVAELRLIHR